jgi:hypothetical protein
MGNKRNILGNNHMDFLKSVLNQIKFLQIFQIIVIEEGESSHSRLMSSRIGTNKWKDSSLDKLLSTTQL